MRALPSWFYLNLITSQRSSSLNTITLELGLQHMNLKGWVGNTTQSIATLDQENIKQSQWGSAQCRNSGRYCRICLKVIHPKQWGSGLFIYWFPSAMDWELFPGGTDPQPLWSAHGSWALSRDQKRPSGRARCLRLKLLGLRVRCGPCREGGALVTLGGAVAMELWVQKSQGSWLSLNRW